MKNFKKLFSFILVAVLCLSLAACGSTPPSNSGNSDSPKKTDLKVVAGTVSAAQYLNALGAKVVGVPTTSKNLPEAYKDVAKIGMPMSPNIEMILATDPDVFVADSSSRATLEEVFYGKNVDLVLLDNNSYDSISTNISLLAEKLGLEDKAKEVLATVEAKKQEALGLSKDKTQPKVAIIFGTTAMFMLATDKSCVGSMVDMLGAPNITDNLELGDSYVTFDREKLAELNPEVILRLSHADPDETAKAFESEFSKPFWQSIKAVQDKRVYDLDPLYFSVTANFDTVDAPKLLAEMIYK